MKDAREPLSPAAWRSPDLEIRIGISSCLLGETVRYDGGHQKDSYVTGALARHVTWVSVCPEMELGLGVPRETIRLVGDAAKPRLVATRSGTDLTEAMNTYARARVGGLGTLRLSGYILKRASPSCGMERVKVYTKSGIASRSGRGLFARRLMDTYPLLPVEEEGRLADARLRDNFITRVFAYRRLRALEESGPRAKDIVAFHTAHKLLLLAHSPAHYSALSLQGLRRGPGAAGGAYDAHQSPRGEARRRLCRRPDLLLAVPEGAHAPPSGLKRLGSPSQRLHNGNATQRGLRRRPPPPSGA